MRYVGIDVSAKTLSVVLRDNGISSECEEFENTPAGHKHLIKYIKSNSKKHTIRVCLEATGMYHFDCTVTLSKAKNIEVMVINPKASKNFAGALMQRGKTDAVDANMLAIYCERMDFVVWHRPPKAFLTLRSYGRKLMSLAEMKAQLKNQSHALSLTEETPEEVLEVQKTLINSFEKQIVQLQKCAIKFIHEDAELLRLFELLISIKGIGDLSAIQILGELLVLPNDMSAKQWVAHSGLNPTIYQSGTSVNKKTRISKVGNRYLRRALYMPALSASNTDPYVRGYYWHLIQDSGLKKRQALCAVMRKQLHAIHRMFETGECFENTRFYKHPLEKSPRKTELRHEAS